jgi:hypothetical protein
MTKKLTELFNLPPSLGQSLDSESLDDASSEHLPDDIDPVVLQELDQTIDKVEAALPTVRGLDTTDSELDELAALAVDGYRTLNDLAMQVESRFASEIFSVASSMLGHAITAKTAKIDKKLKMVDLQLKKIRLDQQAPPAPSGATLQDGQGVVVSRNDLLAQIINRDKK